MIEENDTMLPMGKFNVAPFGPTGIMNNNDLSSVGQGLKKMFKPQTEMPRQFKTIEMQNSPKRNATSGTLGGSGSLPQGAIAKQFDVCENGQPKQYWFIVWEEKPF